MQDKAHNLKAIKKNHFIFPYILPHVFLLLLSEVSNHSYPDAQIYYRERKDNLEYTKNMLVMFVFLCHDTEKMKQGKR